MTARSELGATISRNFGLPIITGLRTGFIAGGKKGLALVDETRARIHALSAAYGVRTLRLGVIDGLCSDCAGLLVPSAEANAADAARAHP